jgi:hypothetical protein
VTTPEDYKAALGRAYQTAVKNNIATLINVQSSRAFLSPEDFPPGTPRNIELSVSLDIGRGARAIEAQAARGFTRADLFPARDPEDIPSTTTQADSG